MGEFVNGVDDGVVYGGVNCIVVNGVIVVYSVGNVFIVYKECIIFAPEDIIVASI